MTAMTEEQRKQRYQEKADEQMRRWVEGNPIHNPLSPSKLIEGGECCPDFSCCKPHLLAPRQVRQAFQKAQQEDDSATVQRMLAGFLGAMLEAEGHQVVTSADVRGKPVQ